MQDTYRDQSAMVEEVAKCATRNVLQEKLRKLYSTNQTGESTIKINENLESAFYEDNYVKKNESLIKVCEECLSVVAKVGPSLHKSRSPAQQSNLI